jgi:hypothetical protein
VIAEQKTWGGQIPILQDHAYQLLSLANDIVSTRIEPHDTTDLLGVMIDMFTQKLIDHLKSIRILVDAGQYQDATIIARSSYESMGLLLWSAHGPTGNPRESRPLQWFAYEYIDRYHQMERYHQLGMEPNPETEKTIRQGVQEFADLFLTNDASRAIRQGKAPKKRLFKDRIKFGNVIDELKEKGLIDPEAHQRYAMLSQWPHGTSQGMGMVFCNDGKRVSLDTDTCKSLGADAIIIGIRSLGDTALLFNDHFRLDFRDKLMESHKSFSDYLQNAKVWGLF